MVVVVAVVVVVGINKFHSNEVEKKTLKKKKRKLQKILHKGASKFKTKLDFTFGVSGNELPLLVDFIERNVSDETDSIMAFDTHAKRGK